MYSLYLATCEPNHPPTPHDPVTQQRIDIFDSLRLDSDQVEVCFTTDLEEPMICAWNYEDEVFVDTDGTQYRDIHPDDFEDWEAAEREELYYDQCFGGGKPTELD